MKIDVLTIFPKMFDSPFSQSLIAKAQEKKIVEINAVDIRSFSKDKHKKVDDKPFGGGVGMVLTLQPIVNSLKSLGVKKRNSLYKNPFSKPLIIYMSPQGKPLNNSIVKNLSKFKHLIILCGHYEGIDERITNFIDQELSIGDYVLTGGEIPAMVLIDSVVRMLPTVVKESDSVKNDSFFNGLLDYPHYTRPAIFNGLKVPKVLLSGNHKQVEDWRKAQSIQRTKKRRPDLLKNIERSKKCH
jgi:tRNA (guanine37-N1)-methyltransferase